MKAIFLTFLFFTLYTVQALSNPDPERSFTLNHEGLNLSKHNMEGQEQGIKGKLEFVKEVREMEENHGEMFASHKGQKGTTGAYGGANIVHNPQSNAEATLFMRHSLFVSAILSFVNFALILISPF